jgi:quercetin dioxygenase-like cupin family protein
MNAKRRCVGKPGYELTDRRGQRLVLLMTSSASEGRKLVMDWFVPPGQRLAAADHYHPDGPERWEILAGTGGYRLDGQEHTATAPHEFVVPPATSHGHPWNAGDDLLKARQTIESDEPIPELIGGVQGFFETMFAFSQRGEVSEKGDIGGRIQNLLTIHDLLMPGTFLAGPPRLAQRGLLGGISAAARLSGMDAYHEPVFADAAS